MTNKIEFEPSDWPTPHLEPTAHKIAVFLHTYKSKIIDFNTFMRISGTWKMIDYVPKLQKWISGIMPRPKKAATDTREMIALIEQIFSVCNNDDDWGKIRGLIAEKVFEIFFSKRHPNGVKIGYGVKVKINSQEVKYRPNSNFNSGQDSDGPRQTVDAGSWDSLFGEFVEVKFNPEAFHTKDINYLKLLESTLNHAMIRHQIYLVTFDDPDLIKNKLKQIGLLNHTSRFKLLGKSEILVS